MKADACNVCGGTDVNLVDGYYYCVECGTQDENVRETVVEQTVIADGTFARTTSKKITKSNIQMTKEWYKWHTLNFILSGMADELIALGAQPSFKIKLLWIWSRYIKMYQKKEETEILDVLSQETLKESPSDDDNSEKENKEDKDEKETKICDIKVATITVLHAILYSALNLDNSDLQLSHISRFRREGRLSSVDCLKYVPKEMKVECIAKWSNFSISRYRTCTLKKLRYTVISVFKALDLGTPNIPNMRKIIQRFVKELCLPDHFTNLVYSLMLQIPWKSILSSTNIKMARLPDFEGVAMAFIVMGLKICFGLDDNYEVILSEAVEKANDKNNYAKSFKFDIFLDNTERLFSFNEWAKYIHCRNILLSKYYFPCTLQNNYEVDDYAFLRYTIERYTDDSYVNISDQVTSDLFKKISSYNNDFETYNIKFPPSLIPMSIYPEIIATHIEDPDLRLLLCEDFTKYSMKYCTINCKFIMDKENIVIGVSEINKLQEDIILGDIVPLGHNKKMIYVRNCENKNWILTKPPKLEHITKNHGTDDSLDKVSEYSLDTSCDVLKLDKENSSNNAYLDLLCEEDKNIYDDNLDDDDKTKYTMESESNINMNDNDLFENNDKSFVFNNANNIQENNEISESIGGFDLQTFDREKAIKQLLTIACQNYGVPLPKQYRHKTERKRKLINPELATDAKLKKTGHTRNTDAKMEVAKIVDIYHRKVIRDIVENECFNEINMFNEETEIKKAVNVLASHEIDISPVDYINNDTKFDLNANNGKSSIAEDSETEDQSNFDEKLYDIKQLYVKLKESHFEEVVLDTDSDLDRILMKAMNDSTNNEDVEDDQSTFSSHSNKEDASRVFSRQMTQQYKDCVTKLNAEKKNRSPLILNQKCNEYGYWIRHYAENALTRNCYSTRLFDMELLNNFSKSFSYILNICASLSESSSLDIYTYLVKIEEYLLNHREDE